MNRRSFQKTLLAGALALGISRARGSVLAELQQRRRWDFDGVSFENMFSGARLSELLRVGEGHYLAISRPEVRPINPSPWYAFAVTSKKPRSIQITIRVDSGDDMEMPLKASRPWLSRDESDFSVLPVEAWDTRGIDRTARLDIPAGRLMVAAWKPVSLERVESAVAAAAIESPRLLDLIASTLPKRDASIDAGPVLNRLLESEETPARLAGCKLARALGNHAGHGATLRSIIGNPDEDLPLRQEALKAYSASDRTAAPALLLSLLEARAPGLELTAIEAGAPLLPEKVAAHCAATLPGLRDPEEIAARIRPFLGIQDGAAILANAISATALPSETADMAMQWMSKVGRDDKPLLEVFQRAAGIQGNRAPYSAELVKRLVDDAMAEGDAIEPERSRM